MIERVYKLSKTSPEVPKKIQKIKENSQKWIANEHMKDSSILDVAK